MTANTNARALLSGAQAAARYLTRVDACATNGACVPYSELHRQLVALGGLHREETQGFLQHIQDQLQLMHAGPAPHRTAVRPDIVGRIVRRHIDRWYSGPSDASLVDALSDAVVDVLTSHPQAMPQLTAKSLWLQATHDVIVGDPPLPATQIPPWEPDPPLPSNTARGA